MKLKFEESIAAQKWILSRISMLRSLSIPAAVINQGNPEHRIAMSTPLLECINKFKAVDPVWIRLQQYCEVLLQGKQLSIKTVDSDSFELFLVENKCSADTFMFWKACATVEIPYSLHNKFTKRSDKVLSLEEVLRSSENHQWNDTSEALNKVWHPWHSIAHKCKKVMGFNEIAKPEEIFGQSPKYLKSSYIVLRRKGTQVYESIPLKNWSDLDKNQYEHEVYGKGSMSECDRIAKELNQN